jgi:hypothetical protein
LRSLENIFFRDAPRRASYGSFRKRTTMHKRCAAQQRGAQSRDGAPQARQRQDAHNLATREH